MNYFVKSLGEEQQKVLNKVLERAGEDKKYREKLKSSPGAAINEETGVNIPNGMDIRFIENEADLTIVLPDMEKEEISIDDLESVTGGEEGVDWNCPLDVVHYGE